MVIRKTSLKTIIMICIFILASNGIADNIISLGTPVVAGEGSVEIPVLLTSDQNLSLFSVILGYRDGFEFQESDIQINESRFPWKSKSLVISNNDAGKQIVITVADLLGRNTMVLPGGGVLFTVTSNITDPHTPESPLTIKQVQAFNLKGDSVDIAVK